MNPKLSVVIPCYNEEQNIRLGALDKIARYMEMREYSWEGLIVDDGSSDQSPQLIQEFINSNSHFKLLARPHQGKAAAVIAGMLVARGELVLFTDLDQATPINQLEKLLPWMSQGFDVVIGSRKGGRSGAPFLRRLMGPGFIFMRNLILGLKGIEDTQCGFKLFKRTTAKEIFNRLIIFSGQMHVAGPRVTAGFDVEVLFVARKLNYKIKEVPVEWHYVDTRRVSPLLDSLDALTDIIRIRLNSIQGKYNL